MLQVAPVIHGHGIVRLILMTDLTDLLGRAMGGVEIKLGADSNLSFVIEAGYRSTNIKDADSYELNMSGPIARVGVSFPLEMTE